MKHNNNNSTQSQLDENPPPYTPHNTSTSSTYAQFPNSYPSEGTNTYPQNPSTSSSNAHGIFSSPPDYAEATSSNNNKGKQALSQRPNNFQDSLSNLLNMTSNVVGVSRRPVGLPPLRTITSTAAEAGKIAMNMVEDILTESFDDQETRRRKKNMRKIQRKEDRQRLSEQLDQFTSALSQYTGLSSFSVPQQSKRLEISQNSGPLTYEGDWSGKVCRLKTSMAPLTVRGVLTARETISIENSTGMIVLHSSLFSKQDIHIRTVHGSLSVLGQLQAGRQLDIQLANAPITIETRMEAEEAKIKTKNAPIMLTQAVVQRQLEVKTSNSPIVLHVLDIMRRDAEIDVESTNAPVTVYLPRTFSGRFHVSSTSTASVVSRTDDVRLAFEKEENNKKYGRCMNMGNKSNVQITIKTTNAPALLYI